MITDIKYLKITHNIFYNLILLFPLLLCYEILGIIINYNMLFEIRNGADILIREFYLLFGLYGEISLFITLFIFSLYFFLKGKIEIKNNTVKYSILWGMIIEGIFFGFILYLLFNNNFNLLTINQNKYHALIMLYLSIGAGIFEEFIF